MNTSLVQTPAHFESDFMFVKISATSVFFGQSRQISTLFCTTDFVRRIGVVDRSQYVLCGSDIIDMWLMD